MFLANNRNCKVALLIVPLILSVPAQAQQTEKDRAAHDEPSAYHTAEPSDLAKDNLDRVAASAAQIQGVLLKDAGLLVELKRWVAKEASNNGQVVEDSDLTDQAVFDRLARDVALRSVATRLLQRYGYLLPAVNPGSDFAKEQDLILKERARRLVQIESEEDTRSLRLGNDLERTASCNPREDEDCVPSRARASRRGQAPRSPGETGTPETSPAVPPDQNLHPLTSPRTLRAGAERQEDGLTAPVNVEVAGTENLEASVEMQRSVPRAGTMTNGIPQVTSRDLGQPSDMEPSKGSLARRPRESTERRGRAEAELSPVAMVHRANPYADIPSLYDMYVQAASRQRKTERFGLEVFRNSAAEPDAIPMDLPVGPDYVVGPGDGLAIDLWGGVSQRFFRVVDREGRLSLPEVGPLLVSGKTLGDLQLSVQHVLRTQFRDVSADVSLSRLRTVRVYVVGDVAEPGAYDISSLSTPLNALFSAGGVTPQGSLRSLKHYRGKELIEEVDAYDLLLHGVRGDLKRLENGDTLLVPPIGPQVTVDGMVRRPAIYELHGETSLAEVLELAGGILPTATLRHIEVQRVATHEKRTMLTVELSAEGGSEAVNQQLTAFKIQDGDEVHIFPIAPYNQSVIYVQGHVLRPGRYSFHDGMKLTDLIASYGDLLPEPSAHYAEIIRLNAPDYHPSVESFDLSAALANPAAAPKLQPLDTVRVYSRYDFESAPAVWVGGEVRAPGKHLTSGQAHLRDAVYLAGGVTPDASLDSAQLFRTQHDGVVKILSVNLREALDGNPVDNIALQPRDHILVHRKPARVDPPTVLVKGEVAKPGRYPLAENMRVSDLVRAAGAFKRSAAAETADLTRYPASESGQPAGKHYPVNLAAALSGDANQDLPLRDGDVLTIPQVPGWNDIGAVITVRGEVKNPGVYGIRQGERLSAVLERAGGFRPTAYPQAAVLERVDVRQLQEKARQELIQRLEQEAASVKTSATASASEQATLQQAAFQQRERALEGVRKAAATGRLVVNLSGNLQKFAKSPYDIEVRAGDIIEIPKPPGFVLVVGQVYNSNAITYRPDMNAGWYLSRAGGPTHLGDKGAIFIVHANGLVESGRSRLWTGGVLSRPIGPGDTIVVPEKAIGGGVVWKNLLAVAQIAQAGALTAAVAGL
jgi:polysaccharide export outer membrane protein